MDSAQIIFRPLVGMTESEFEEMRLQVEEETKQYQMAIKAYRIYARKI